MLRNKLMRWVLAAVIGLGLLIPTAPGAAADDPVACAINPRTGQCYAEVGGPGDSGGPDGSTPGSRSNRTPTCVHVAYVPPKRVPCRSALGIWIQERACYAKRLDPQPPADDIIWGGRTGGAVYVCAISEPYYRWGNIWLSDPPVVRVDPEVVAEQVVKSMGLRRVTIGIAPEPGPNNLGLVGVPVYMWVTDPGPQTTGPQSLSASESGVTITVAAKTQRIVWQMGDGTSVTCTGPGTPYQDSFGFRPSPTCGHTYTKSSAGKAGDAYRVSATSYWRVDWSGAGESGFFEFSFTSATSIRVGEAQVLVTKPNG